MPLRAIIDGKEINSPFLSIEEWNELKEEIKKKSLDVTISQTNKKGYLRTSKLGLQHFVHKKGESPQNWKPEKQQYLLSKSEIMLACKESGWEVKSEYISDNWTADVFAVKGSKKIAFQVQWSKQSYDETKERQTKYKNDNIRGCWFFKTPPKEVRDWDKQIIATKDIPIFKIEEDDNKNINVNVNEINFPLKIFIIKLLNGNFKFCNNLKSMKKQKITISFWEIICWKCGEKQHVYFVSDEVKSKCGCNIDVMETLWDDSKFLFNPVILKMINEIINSEDGKNLKLGEIKKRYSHTIKKSYISFGCIKCDAIFGDFPLMEERLEIESEDRINDIVFVKKIDLLKPIISKNKPHWCFSELKEFCE